jgi:hypothetical protein
MTTTSEIEHPQPGKPWIRRLSELPWWGLTILLAGALVVYFLFTSAPFQSAFVFLVGGVRLTLIISIASFGIALLLGLIAGLGRVSKNTEPDYHPSNWTGQILVQPSHPGCGYDDQGDCGDGLCLRRF